MFAEKSYSEFKSLIPKKFIITQGPNKPPDVDDFREVVGETIRDFRRQDMALHSAKHGRHERWPIWLQEVDLGDDVVPLIDAIDDGTISGLKNNQSHIEFYIAIYYRLHAFLEDSSFSDSIDNLVFGEPLRKRGVEVSSSVDTSDRDGEFEQLSKTELLISQMLQNSSRDAHRAELILFAPKINEYLSLLGEFQELVEIILADLGSSIAASMLKNRIDDFKGFSVGSDDGLYTEMGSVAQIS